MSADVQSRRRFGEFEFDIETLELRRNGEIVTLAPQPSRALGLLVTHAGELVTREQLRSLLWPNSIVEFDHGINTCIRQIREALGDHGGHPSLLHTVPRRGYRFVVPATPMVGTGPTTVPEPPSVASVDLDRTSRTTGRSRWRWGLAGTAIAVVAVFAVSRITAPEVDGAGPRVAVLTFRALDLAAEYEGVAYGLREDLIIALDTAGSKNLHVIVPPGDVTQMVAGSTGNPTAEYAVTGTLRVSGGRMLMTARLHRVADGETFSLAVFDEDLDSVAEHQPAIARTLAASILAELNRLTRGNWADE